MLVTKQLLVATDLHRMEKNAMEVNGDWKLFGYLHSSKYLETLNYVVPELPSLQDVIFRLRKYLFLWQLS